MQIELEDKKAILNSWKALSKDEEWGRYLFITYFTSYPADFKYFSFNKIAKINDTDPHLNLLGTKVMRKFNEIIKNIQNKRVLKKLLDDHIERHNRFNISNESYNNFRAAILKMFAQRYKVDPYVIKLWDKLLIQLFEFIMNESKQKQPEQRSSRSKDPPKLNTLQKPPQIVVESKRKASMKDLLKAAAYKEDMGNSKESNLDVNATPGTTNDKPVTSSSKQTVITGRNSNAKVITPMKPSQPGVTTPKKKADVSSKPPNVQRTSIDKQKPHAPIPMKNLNVSKPPSKK